MLLKVDIHSQPRNKGKKHKHPMLDMQINDASGNSFKKRHQKL